MSMIDRAFGFLSEKLLVLAREFEDFVPLLSLEPETVIIRFETP